MSQRLKTLHQLITHKIRSWNTTEQFGCRSDPNIWFQKWLFWCSFPGFVWLQFSLCDHSQIKDIFSPRSVTFFFLTRTHQQPIRVQTCPRRKKTLCVNMSEYFQCYCTSPQVEVQYVVPPWMWVYDFSVESHYIFSFQPQNSKFWIWKKYNLSQVLYQI